MTSTNPWGLTLRQCQVAASLVKLRRVRLVADYLDISDKNVYYSLGVIARKMGQEGACRCRLGVPRLGARADRAGQGDTMSPLDFHLEHADVPQPTLYDAELVTCDPWPMPPVTPWKPKPLTWWARVMRWMGVRK